MYYANCEWYVDMGEHYKPLCERNSLRPAKCSECPVYIGSIEAENAKLRELFEKTYGYYVSGTFTPCDFCKRLDCQGNAPTTCEADEYDPDGIVNNEIERLMRELGIEVE